MEGHYPEVEERRRRAVLYTDIAIAFFILSLLADIFFLAFGPGIIELSVKGYQALPPAILEEVREIEYGAIVLGLTVTSICLAFSVAIRSRVIASRYMEAHALDSVLLCIAAVLFGGLFGGIFLLLARSDLLILGDPSNSF
ncbi:hypothetical protein [Thermogymnomonas acidicola]|nr:hypothetical protein [Thermogymnomonas acidicola]